MHSEIVMGVVCAGVTLGLIAVIIMGVSVGISLTENGVLWHPGWRRYSPRLLILVKDMRENPGSYRRDRFTLESSLICVWIANGWSFYKDYTNWRQPPQHIGPMSVFDRFLFRRALAEFGAGSPLDFELALRRANGMIWEKK